MQKKYILRVIYFTFDDLWKSGVSTAVHCGDKSSFANTSENKSPAFLIEMDHNLFVYFHCSLR